MSGLIIKDLFNLNSNKRIYLVLLIMFVFSAFIIDSGVSFMSVYMSILCMMLCISTFSYDDYSKWNRYALALPLTRKDIVKSRYVFALILIGLSFIVGSLVNLIGLFVYDSVITLELIFSIPLATIIVITIIIAILFPAMYKYGAEKGRLVLLLFSILLGIAGYGINYLFRNITIDVTLLNNGMSFLMNYGVYLIILIALLSLYISYIKSIQIYQKKEF